MLAVTIFNMTFFIHNRDRVYIFLLILFALLVRIYCSPHILMGDEGNNMLTIKALIEGDGPRQFFYVHPPLFLIISSLISYPFGDNHIVVQYISIAFSTLAMIPFYLIATQLFDRRTALVSLLTIAILPMNMYYSTWIKPEATLLLLVLWSLYLYITFRPYTSGLVFGIASLTKEFSLFIIPTVLSWEIIRGWKFRESLKRYLLWLLIGVTVSMWWYVSVGKISFAVIGEALGGSNPYEIAWHYPWYYYLRNLKGDITLVLIPFFLIGMFSLKKRTSFLPVFWILSIYVPLSLIRVKTPWYVYLASPAVSMIIAVGLLKTWDLLRSKWMRYFFAALVTMSVSYNIYTFDANKHFAWLLISGDFPSFNWKEYQDKGRVFLQGDSRIAVLDYNPSLQYFLGISDQRLFFIESELQQKFSSTSADILRDAAEKFGIGYFVIDTDSLIYSDPPKFNERNISDLTALYGEPRKVGNVLIYKVEADN